MKNMQPELIELLKVGNCTPRLSKLAAKMHSKANTIHYNVKQMEAHGLIKTYKAVFDYKKIDEGFCTYVLINLDRKEYKTPDEVAEELAKYDQIESVDIITGGWEIIIKVRSKSIDEYYDFAKKVLSMKGIDRTHSLNSLRQVKTEFVKV